MSIHTRDIHTFMFVIISETYFFKYHKCTYKYMSTYTQVYIPLYEYFTIIFVLIQVLNELEHDST